MDNALKEWPKAAMDPWQCVIEVSFDYKAQKRGLTHVHMLMIGQRRFVFEKRPPCPKDRGPWEPEVREPWGIP